MRKSVLMVAGLAASVVVIGCSPTTSGSTDSATSDELESVLEQVTENVSIPSGWTVERTGVKFGGLGYQVIEDALDRANWLIVSAAPIENLATPDDPEASLQDFLARHVVGKGGRTVADPTATTTSGVDGFLFEVEGLASGDTQLGTFVAIFYGTQYYYQVIAQFRLADRDQINSVWQDALTSVTFIEASIEPETL